MTKEQLAKLLNGMNVKDPIPLEIKAIAKASGLVIMHIADEPLVDFDGAIADISSSLKFVDGNAIVNIDKEGYIRSFPDCNANGAKALSEYYRRMPESVSILVQRHKVSDYEWAFKTEIPHAKFEIQDDEPHCQGIVFNLSDV